MGLLAILKKIKQKEKEMRLLILGLDSAGKTTILKRFCGEPIDKIEPTLGFNIQSLQHAGYTLNLWDVGGQKSIRAYWRNYFESTDGLVWVVDSTDRMRLELCKQELLDLLQQERLAGASLLLFANKQDIVGALSASDIADVLELNTNKQYDNRHWSIHACSAVTGEGLIEGRGWIVDDIGNRIYMLA
jgi:ADP-ribosylation factor-like protein 2